MILIYLLLILPINGFITNNIISKKINRHKTLINRSHVIDPLVEITYGDEENKIQLLSNEKVKILLDCWSMNTEYETREMREMYMILNNDDPNDLFLGYSPKYNGKNRIIYIFLAKVLINNNEKDSPLTIAYLSIIMGISCPYVKGYVSSFEFKKLVQEAIPIMGIDFGPLLKNPKFSLSWKLEE